MFPRAFTDKCSWLGAAALFASLGFAHAALPDFHAWAPTPPMGWNSWDCFGATVTEAQTKAQAAYMAAQLKSHGWSYIVADIQWYEPSASGYGYRAGAALAMDDWGRLLPAANRFPSSAGGAGFKPLADYVHSLGLKFGVHLMRGIPRQAVERNVAIKGTTVHARDIADRNSTCPWNPDMFGVDLAKPGAQDYYDSVFALFASWGIDYVKVDDISRPYHEHEREIEAIRRAIDRSGRPIVLSLSPGETALDAAAHVQQHANLWRISDDFWDRWLALREQFARLERWNPYRIPGAWPDADMLPFGVLNLGSRSTRFTADEQRTVMTLWSIARCPLFQGGDLTKTDAATLALLTNDAVLAVDQHSTHNRPLFSRDGLVAWTADVPGSPDKYVAVFNTRDRIPLVPERASFRSEVVSRRSAARDVVIDVPLDGANALFLVVDPTEDGSEHDEVIWMEPRFVMADGSSRRATDTPWVHADALWDHAYVDRTAGGKPLTHGGRPVAFGIGTNAVSLIRYALPAGARSFHTVATLDDDALAAKDGGTVRFLVYATRPQDEFPQDRVPVPVALSDLGLRGPVLVRDLWTGRSLGKVKDGFAPEIPFHGAGLYRLSPR